jgi:hypothetical protein
MERKTVNEYLAQLQPGLLEPTRHNGSAPLADQAAPDGSESTPRPPGDAADPSEAAIDLGFLGTSIAGATFGYAGGKTAYRYTLWRRWSQGPYLNVVGLNPSTADAETDDPTIRKCIGFAKLWGYSALCMTNLFAYRATRPVAMMTQSEICPVGPANDAYVYAGARKAGIVLCAWGVNGWYLGRDSAVRGMLSLVGAKTRALRLTKAGYPEHPLYIPYVTELKQYP